MEVTCYDNTGVEQSLELGKTYKVYCDWAHGYCISRGGKILSFQSYRFEQPKQEQPKPKAKKKTLFDNVFGNLK